MGNYPENFYGFDTLAPIDTEMTIEEWKFWIAIFAYF